jgi:hypothetical protein
MAGVLRISKDAIANVVKAVVVASKERIAPQSVDAGGSVTLKDTGATPLKFAVVLLLGDGESQIRYDVTVGNTTESIYANEFKVLLVVNEALRIVAVNTDSANTHSTGTIEIGCISVG